MLSGGEPYFLVWAIRMHGGRRVRMWPVTGQTSSLGCIRPVVTFLTSNALSSS